MKNWQITGICAILIFGFLLMSDCTKSPETLYSAIKTHDEYSIDYEGHATLKYIHGYRNIYQYWHEAIYLLGGVTLYDSLNVLQDFMGENMTLNPGESKTIVKTYVVSYRYKTKGSGIVVWEHELK